MKNALATEYALTNTLLHGSQSATLQFEFDVKAIIFTIAF